MADTNQRFPYKTLGSRLRGMRERVSESVAEVSGAVEIDVDALVAIEQGIQRPSEDILLLLLSHFAVKDEEATKLWQLAGYTPSDHTTDRFSPDSLNLDKHAVLVMPLDIKIAYTDMAHVVINNHGVVLNFMQTNGPNNQPLVVSRLGMSREHAQSLLELLQKTLSHKPDAPKALPAPDVTLDGDVSQSQ